MSSRLNQFWQSYKPLIIITTIVVVFDQITKAWVRATLWPTQVWMPLAWLEPYLKIVNWKNTGGSFGFFPDGGLFFILLALIAVVVIFFYYPRIAGQDYSLRLALAFLMGGICGNLLDRLHQGYVTDFISVGPTYVINLADLSNLVGVIIAIIGAVQEEQKKRSHSVTANAKNQDES